MECTHAVHSHIASDWKCGWKWCNRIVCFLLQRFHSKQMIKILLLHSRSIFCRLNFYVNNILFNGAIFIASDCNKQIIWMFLIVLRFVCWYVVVAVAAAATFFRFCTRFFRIHGTFWDFQASFLDVPLLPDTYNKNNTPPKRITFSVSLILTLTGALAHSPNGFVCLYMFLMFYLFFLLAHSCRASPVGFNFSFNFVLFARFIHTFCSNMLLEWQR